MIASHGLAAGTVTQIQKTLARFPEVSRAVLFGSRAKGIFRNGSDIDLALAGNGVDWKLLGRIETALDDLMTPYSFSLIELSNDTDREVADHVHRVGKTFYERTGSDAEAA